MTMMSFCERAEDERLDYAANTEWSARVPSPPKKREIYILRGEKEVFLLIPTDSRGIATLEDLLERNR